MGSGHGRLVGGRDSEVVDTEGQRETHGKLFPKGVQGVKINQLKASSEMHTSPKTGASAVGHPQSMWELDSPEGRTGPLSSKRVHLGQEEDMCAL